MAKHHENSRHKVKLLHIAYVPFIFALALASSALAQDDNLVDNPSFEEHDECPQRISSLGVMNGVTAWWQPTLGSSDYFHRCGGKECSVPRNKMGYQDPHSGDAYCGIYCSQEHYREYLQTELRRPLVAGWRYRVAFYVSLADKSPHAVATIGALLTSQRITDSSHNILMQHDDTTLNGSTNQTIAIYFTPQLQHTAETPLDNTHDWTLLETEITAAGGERFLTIGNFKPFNHSTVTDLDNPSANLPGAYYYIDDVSIRCIDSSATVADTIPPDTIQTDSIIVLRNIFFATNDSRLLQQSHRELMMLVDILRSHPTMHIEIRGHTDNIGTANYNLHLSQNRARAVVDFLVRHGIDSRRLQWNGYGKSQPMADNSTPEGRQLNRRVEYRIIHQ